MLLCFKLSMPNVGSWNSKWTGANSLYARVVNFGSSKKAKEKAITILNKGYFHYNFGDGWSTGISVSQINAKEAASIRRKSAGFCGYDWMIESIKDNNQIRPTQKTCG